MENPKDSLVQFLKENHPIDVESARALNELYDYGYYILTNEQQEKLKDKTLGELNESPYKTLTVHTRNKLGGNDDNVVVLKTSIMSKLDSIIYLLKNKI